MFGKETLWVLAALLMLTAPACKTGDLANVFGTPEPIPAEEPAAGDELLAAVEAADTEDWIAAVEKTAITASPYGAFGVLIWRLIRKHRAGQSLAQSVQPLVDKLNESERAALGEKQSKSAKRLIRQSRGKSTNIPL